MDYFFFVSKKYIDSIYLHTTLGNRGIRTIKNNNIIRSQILILININTITYIAKNSTCSFILDG